MLLTDNGGGSVTGLSVTDGCRWRAVMRPLCAGESPTRWSILTTIEKLMNWELVACRGPATMTRYHERTACLMKLTTTRPYADPEAAARKLIEIANSVEAVQDGRIFIELINGPMLFEHKATPAEYSAGLKLAIERGWLTLDRSGTYVKFTQAGAELFA
jgi:hypothetical protein